MGKQHTLASPFGEVRIRILSDHTHVEATTPLAADWGLGWWHAHQAGDEAVFERTFWRGELGADHHPSVGRTELDTFIDQWGFEADLPLEMASLSAGHRSRVQAYTLGFNQGRRRKGKEAPWTPEDCQLLARTLGFLEWWEVRAPQRAFLLEAWRAGLSWARIADLWPGIGAEPDSSSWDGLSSPPEFSPEAWTFLSRVRRFRPGVVRVVPASRSTEGRPLLGASYVSDVTDPGLPLWAVRIDSPAGTVRGLGRPGHPGLFSGKTVHLAWHAAPAIDDTIDLRVVEKEQGKVLTGWWAGAGRSGTLGSLLALEEVLTVEEAQEQTATRGSASLDFAAVDAHGGAARWAQGPRWNRSAPRDAWLPTLGGAGAVVGFREPPVPPGEGAGRTGPEHLEALLSQTKSSLPEEALAIFRFLLPDNEEGQRLRKWTGTPEKSPEGALFERVYQEILAEFWAGSPLVPGRDSPVAQSLARTVDRLIQAPHSAWFPSQEKNHRLAEAVRRAFVPRHPGASPLLGRRAPKACWAEVQGGKPRIFASTTCLVVDPVEPVWRVFLTDDETEVPSFAVW